MIPYSAEEAAALLGKQIAALARYRHIVEAQRAVLRMEDAGLLEVFAAEANGIFADISAREVQLLSIRAAVQPNGGASKDRRLAALHEQLVLERARAASAAENLAEQISSDVGRVATEIKATSQALNAQVNGYGRGPAPTGATRIDRVG